MDSEKKLVDALGKSIGYWRVMQLAEECWREHLLASGFPAGGEHSVGPCTYFLVPCPCSGRPGCDYCCGSGRVTRKVAEAMSREGSV